MLPAVTLPSGLKAGFRLASVSAVVPGRMPSSVVTRSLALDDVAGLLVEALLGDPDDLVVEAALVGGALGALLALGAEGVELLAGDAPLVGDHLGRDALRHEARIAVAGEHLVAERDRAGRHRRSPSGWWSSPRRRRRRRCRRHRRSRPGRRSGRPAGTSRTGGRPRWPAPTRGSRRRARRCGRCSGPGCPTCMTQPMITSSMSAGSRWLRSTRCLQHLAGEVGRVPPRQLSVALATRSADGVDDDGGGHGLLLRGHLTGRSSVAGRPPGSQPGRGAAARDRGRSAGGRAHRGDLGNRGGRHPGGRHRARPVDDPPAHPRGARARRRPSRPPRCGSARATTCASSASYPAGESSVTADARGDPARRLRARPRAAGGQRRARTHLHRRASAPCSTSPAARSPAPSSGRGCSRR